MRYLHIDFESFSKFPIKGGAAEYARHPSTELICCYWKWRHEDEVYGTGLMPKIVGHHIKQVEIKKGKRAGKFRKIKQPMYELNPFGLDDLRRMLAEVVKPDVVVCAWNISFERSMWEHVCHKRLGWPSLEPFGISKWQDTMAVARANTLPGKLKDAAKEAGVSNQKDDAGHKAMMRISKPIAVSSTNPYGRDYSPDKWQTVCDYCGQDVRTESDINAAIYPLDVVGPNEQKIWELDQRVNHAGIRVDRKVALGANKIIDDVMAENDEKMSELTDGEVEGVSAGVKMCEWLSLNGCVTDTVAADVVQQLQQLEYDDPRVKQVLNLRAEGSKTSVKKVPAMVAMTGSDSRARYSLAYYGASTGRWAGRGIQLHNLAKGTLLGDIYSNEAFKGVPIESVIEDLCQSIATGNTEYVRALYGNPLEAVSSCLRSMLIADEGKKLIFSDYSSIEARVLAWLAGSKRIVETFERGECVYKLQAGDIYEIDNPQAMDKKDPRRQVGKQAVLGLGYGMGVDKFYATCLKNGIDIDRDFAKVVVEAYRKSNREIKDFWYGVEKAAIAAIKTPNKATSYRSIRFCKRTKGLSPLICMLPSGRCLFYLNAKLVKSETPWGEKRDQITYRGTDSTSNNPNAFGWVRTYSGKLVENITQAVARDVMVDAMLNLDARGHQMMLTVHDEIVTQSDLSTPVSEIENIMKEVPSWAKGLPLDAEGDEGLRYRK